MQNLFGDKLFKCDECDKSYHTEISRTVHKRGVHSSQHITCSICNKLFRSYWQLSAHHQKEHRHDNDVYNSLN